MVDANTEVKFTEKPFSNYRGIVRDLMISGRKKHSVHGIARFDVTDIRKYFAEKKKEGESHSFSSYLISCIGQAIKKYPFMNSYRKRKKLITFEDVDVSTIIEKEINVQGVVKKMPTNYIVRGVQNKTYQEIQDLIRSAQSLNPNEVNKEADANRNLYFRLPRFIQKLVWLKMERDPFFHKDRSGTVGLTAIGMFTGKLGGWALPITNQSLTFTVGGIGQELRRIDGKIEDREILCITMTIDHDLVDGGPATRFFMHLGDLLENGSGILS
jgi:pyruvate/2-oxoglutarate dehydrogenase complex dihydrolipoamide acyltransferase (E2) component